MKSYVFEVLVLLTFCGCSDSAPTPSAVALQESAILIGALETNSSVRTIKRTGGVRAMLDVIADSEKRNATMRKWRTALFGISLEGLSPSERYGSIREVSRMATRDMVGAMWDMGGSYEEVWETYFETLTWLDKQCCAMKPKEPSLDCDWREEKSKWDYYGALVEHRECVIENLELNGFDDGLYHVGAARIDVARKKFETLIGRPVRPSGEIKLLGRYAKEARKRVLKERDDAFRRDK